MASLGMGNFFGGVVSGAQSGLNMYQQYMQMEQQKADQDEQAKITKANNALPNIGAPKVTGQIAAGPAVPSAASAAIQVPDQSAVPSTGLGTANPSATINDAVAASPGAMAAPSPAQAAAAAAVLGAPAGATALPNPNQMPGQQPLPPITVVAPAVQPAAAPTTALPQVAVPTPPAPTPDQQAAANFAQNSAYAVKRPSYQTTLSPADEQGFQAWVKQNNVPFDPSPTADYDMRGFYKGLVTGDPNAQTAVNQNDGQLHFSDNWKTPYHKSFSNESQYAIKDKAPAWNDQDQLVLPNGKVVFDERAAQPSASAAQPAAGPSPPNVPSVPASALPTTTGAVNASPAPPALLAAPPSTPPAIAQVPGQPQVVQQPAVVSPTVTAEDYDIARENNYLRSDRPAMQRIGAAMRSTRLSAESQQQAVTTGKMDIAARVVEQQFNHAAETMASGNVQGGVDEMTSVLNHGVPNGSRVIATPASGPDADNKWVLTHTMNGQVVGKPDPARTLPEIVAMAKGVTNPAGLQDFLEKSAKIKSATSEAKYYDAHGNEIEANLSAHIPEATAAKLRAEAGADSANAAANVAVRDATRQEMQAKANKANQEAEWIRQYQDPKTPEAAKPGILQSLALSQTGLPVADKFYTVDGNGHKYNPASPQPYQFFSKDLNRYVPNGTQDTAIAKDPRYVDKSVYPIDVSDGSMYWHAKNMPDTQGGTDFQSAKKYYEDHQGGASAAGGAPAASAPATSLGGRTRAIFAAPKSAPAPAGMYRDSRTGNLYPMQTPAAPAVAAPLGRPVAHMGSQGRMVTSRVPATSALPVDPPGTYRDMRTGRLLLRPTAALPTDRSN